MAKFNTFNHLEFNNTEGGLFCTYTNKNGAKVAAGLRRIFPSYATQTAQCIELIEAFRNIQGVKGVHLMGHKKEQVIAEIIKESKN